MGQTAQVIRLSERGRSFSSQRQKNHPIFGDGYLDPEEWQNRLDDLRGAIADSGLSLRELSARTRLAVVTMSKFLTRKTVNPRAYTVARLSYAIGLAPPNPELVAKRRFRERVLANWIRNHNRKERAKARRLAARRRAQLTAKKAPKKAKLRRKR